MRPPGSRFSSSNRKAQLGLFAGYFLAGLGALVGALLLLISIFRPDAFLGLRSMAADIASPAGSLGASTRTGTLSVLEAIAGYYRAGSRNAELRREMEIARVRLAEAAATEAENRRLRAVLRLSEGDTRPVDRLHLHQRAPFRVPFGRPAPRRAPGHARHLAVRPGGPRAGGRRGVQPGAAADGQREHGPGTPRHR
jgi:hypothetical protein